MLLGRGGDQSRGSLFEGKRGRQSISSNSEPCRQPSWCLHGDRLASLPAQWRLTGRRGTTRCLAQRPGELSVHPGEVDCREPWARREDAGQRAEGAAISSSQSFTASTPWAASPPLCWAQPQSGQPAALLAEQKRIQFLQPALAALCRAGSWAEPTPRAHTAGGRGARRAGEGDTL